MRSKISAKSILLFVLVSASGTAVVWGPAIGASAKSPQGTLTAPLDKKIIGSGSSGYSSIYTNTVTEHITYYVLGKKIEINRGERSGPQAQWHKKLQELDTAYTITNCSTSCSRALYVSGAYEDGSWAIEKWTFTFPPSTDSASQYVPIDQRRQPTVRMTRLWTGNDKGQIRAIAADPEDRFLLVLTGTPVLWKLKISDSSWSQVYSDQTLPSLSSLYSIKALQHYTEGRKYLLTDVAPTATIVADSTTSVLLSDTNNDTDIDSFQVFSGPTWSSSPYNSSIVWTSPCTH